MTYHIITTRTDKGFTEEFEIAATTDKNEARKIAGDELYRIQRDKDDNENVEIRIYENEEDRLDYNTISIYDSFRVSAIFEDGTSVDNDIIKDTGESAVAAELEVAKDWFADRNPSYYLIRYYLNGKCIRDETR